MQLNNQAYIWLSHVAVCHWCYHNLKPCFNFLSVTVYEKTQLKTLICVLNRTVNVHEWKINTHFKYHIWCLLQIWYIFMEHCIMYGTQCMYKSRIWYCFFKTLHHVGLPSFWTLPIVWCSNQNAFSANGSVPTLRHKRQRCTYSGGFKRKSNSQSLNSEQKNCSLYKILHTSILLHLRKKTAPETV